MRYRILTIIFILALAILAAAPLRAAAEDEHIVVQAATPLAVAEPAEAVSPPAQEAAPPRRSARQESGTAVLNFTDANLKDILRTVAEITGENFIIAPGVSAKISIQTTRPVPRGDVFGIFESLLEVNGLAAVRTGSYYKIVPAPSAKQRGIDIFTSAEDLPPGDKFMNLVVPVEFVSANDIIQVLKPMLSASGNIVNYPRTNTLIITDIATNIKKVVDMIGILDVDAFKKMKIAIIPIKNVDIKTFGRELTDILAVLGLGQDTAQLSVVPIERLNSLIVFASSDDLIASVKEWIEKLDTATAGEGSSIHIYYVKNDKASNIKTVLEQVYAGVKAASPSAQGTAPGQVPPPVRSPQARPDSLNEYAGRSEEIRVFLYEPTNALIIQSSQRDYLNMLGTIRELDRLPKQVLINAFIAEVKLDESTKYGVQWSALTGNFNLQQNTGLVSSTINDPRAAIATPVGVAAAASGLTAFVTDSSKFFGVIQALASTGKINVLSNPHVVVKNYEKASINVGSDEPVATQSTQTAVTGTSGLIQNIEYRKTGVIFTVTPQITEGGMVAMTIRQEVSDKSTDRIVGDRSYPSFTKRETETSVVVKDRETIVIGGLIQEKKDNTDSGIPLLRSIPVIGNLFKYTVRTISKTELIILITPQVIVDSVQATAITEEMAEKLKNLKDLLIKKNTIQ